MFGDIFIKLKRCELSDENMPSEILFGLDELGAEHGFKSGC